MKRRIRLIPSSEKKNELVAKDSGASASPPHPGGPVKKGVFGVSKKRMAQQKIKEELATVGGVGGAVDKIMSFMKPSAGVEEEEEKSPKKIRINATYKDDYDIRELDKIVLQKFARESAGLPKKKTRLGQLEWIKKHSQSSIEVRDAERTAKKLRKEVSEIESNSRLEEYKQRTSKILDEYTKLVSQPQVKQFGPKRVKGNSEADENRQTLISQYLFYVKRYIDINIVRISDKATTCPDCHIELVSESNGLYCPSCHLLLENATEETVSRDSDRPTSTKNDYDRGGHIKDIIINFQGKQKDKIPECLVPDIEGTMKAYGISKSRLSIETLHRLLKESGYSDYYGDIYLIFHKITGKPLEDLAEIQDRLFQKAEMIDKIYYEVKPEERRNFISAYYALWSLLQQEKEKRFHYPKSFFIFPSSRDILISYDEIMESICKKYGGEDKGWKFVAAK